MPTSSGSPMPASPAPCPDEPDSAQPTSSRNQPPERGNAKAHPKSANEDGTGSCARKYVRKYVRGRINPARCEKCGLDHVGVNRFLGIQSCVSLFGVDANLVHYTSALRHPVFVGGENYSGQPSMTKHRLLRDYLGRYLGGEMRALPSALWIPLGPRPAEALLSLSEAEGLERNRILDGLQHPSGANAERIAYFLGRKVKAALSVKTNPVTIDLAREALLRRLATLGTRGE